jgi:hypothetical protein
LAFLLLVALCTLAAWAQISEVTLSGTVTGVDKAPVEGATLTAKEKATKEVRTATTGSEGKYSLLLVPGTYEILVEGKGLPKFSVTIEIVADQPNLLDISVRPPLNDSPEARP